MLSLDFGICDQGISKTGVVSETGTALTANEVTNAFKEGQGRIGGLAAKDCTDGDGECVNLNNSKTKPATDVPDLFDELWDGGFIDTAKPKGKPHLMHPTDQVPSHNDT